MDGVTTAVYERDLTKLTDGERAWLWRRRQASPTGRRKSPAGSRMSVDEAAAALGVRPATFRAVEDESALPAEVEMVASRVGAVEAPNGAEACALARRRSGAKVLDLCEFFLNPARLGADGQVIARYAGEDDVPRGAETVLRPLTKQRFGHWEARGHPRLVAFWRNRGFVFPEGA